MPARARLAAACWAALVAALAFLAGHAQTTWYALLFTAAWSLWRLAAGWPIKGVATAFAMPIEGQTTASARSTFDRALGPRLVTAAWLAAPVALGALLAAIQLLPTAELMQESPRATSAEYEFVMTYSFSPWRLLTLIAPDLLGNPARGRFYGYGNYWEDAIYVGLLPLLLAAGVVAGRLAHALRRRRPGLPTPTEPPAIRGLVLFLSIVSVVALVLALGRNTPVFPFLYHSIPTFNLFQAPTRWMILLTLALALLAGLGAERWQAPAGRALYWTRLGVMGAATLSLMGVLTTLVVRPDTAVTAQIVTVARALALAGVWLLGAALLALLKPRMAPHLWAGLVAVFVAADLLVAGYGLNPGADPAAYRQPAATTPTLAPALGSHRLLYFPDDEYAVKYERFLPFQTYGPPDWALAQRAAQLPNTGLLDGFASANNFDPLVSARYAGFMQVVSATRSLPLLRLMDVAVVASPGPLPGWKRVAQAPTPEGEVGFYQVPAEPSRVWIVPAAHTAADGAAALAALQGPAFDPARVVILEAGDAGRLPSGGSLTPSSNAFIISVTLDQPGWVVLADTHYPGWIATVDGRPEPLLRANYAFRAVAVPAGPHTVVFDYRPASVAVGAWLTGLGFVVWGVAGVLGLRRPRPGAEPASLVPGSLFL
jgi:hypothetical protein